MTELLMVSILAGVGCWGFRKWLALEEKKARLLAYHSISDKEDRAVALTAFEPEVLPKGQHPAVKWVVIALCIAYIICPIDFIPDFIPVLGWGDDVIAAIIAYRMKKSGATG